MPYQCYVVSKHELLVAKVTGYSPDVILTYFPNNFWLVSSNTSPDVHDSLKLIEKKGFPNVLITIRPTHAKVTVTYGDDFWYYMQWHLRISLNP